MIAESRGEIALEYTGLIGLLVLAASCQIGVQASKPVMLELTGDLRVHDPVIIREGDSFYVFSTGGRSRGGLLPVRRSRDLHHWELCGSVFENLPAWVRQEVPGARSVWAPDVSFFNGQYYLYYSVSNFGTNDSAIGLVTNVTLDPDSPDYRWIDKGLVVRSYTGKDNWNAIDGNLVIETPRDVWLCWGSFWSGIKMRRIDPQTGKFSDKDRTLYSLASRPRNDLDQGAATADAVEAPFLIRHSGYWYLFVSFDLCCRGANSTYSVVVGRSRHITGPYVDEESRTMMEGGGTSVIRATTDNWKGPGHCSVLQEAARDYLVFHAYDGRTGRSELKISTMIWQNGWPRVATMP